MAKKKDGEKQLISTLRCDKCEGGIPWLYEQVNDETGVKTITIECGCCCQILYTLRTERW